MSKFDDTLGDFFDSKQSGQIYQNIINTQGLNVKLSSLEKEYPNYPVYNAIANNMDKLLNTKISDIFINAWTKYREIAECLNESRKSPNEIFSVSLAEHKIKSEHNPSLQVLANNIIINDIKFNVIVALMIKSLILEINGGRIRRIQVTGNCQGQGTVKCEGFLILEKRTGIVSLPGTIDLEEEEPQDPLAWNREGRDLLAHDKYDEAHQAFSQAKSNLATSDIDVGEIDTIVVPAKEDRFKETYLGENRWYAIRIRSSMGPQIKYIATYQVAPISSITHIAPVKSIKPWKNSGKYVVNFSEPAHAIGPIPLAKGGRVKAPQFPRYASRQRLLTAKNLDDVW